MPQHEYNRRLETQPTDILDRSKSVTFEFDGASVQGYQGDTIASALLAAGVRTFSRSFKYHRPRGLLCAAGQCPNCLVTVDGVPNVRACAEPAREGVQVRHQNAWPSLGRDFLSILDHLQWLMPVGFYYKALHRPRLLWKLAQRVIRRVGGLGVVDIHAVPEDRYHHEYQHADVAVIGGGPAGLSAALAAAEQGTQVVLVDDQPLLGGSLRFDTRNYTALPGLGDATGFEAAKRLAEAVLASENVQVLSSAAAFGLYQDNLLGILQDNRLIKLRAKQVVLATGSYEMPLVFGKNDLPGIMLSTAAQRLTLLYGVRPGNIAVVATSNDQGYYAATDLLQAGVQVAAVVDLRPASVIPLEVAETLKSRGVEVLASHAVSRAEGKSRVKAVIIVRLDNDAPSGPERRLPCDLLCMSGGFQSADSLLLQAGGALDYDDTLGESVPGRLPPNVHVAGEMTGIYDLAASLLQGELAGKQASAQLATPAGDSGSEVEPLRQELTLAEEQYRASAMSPPRSIAIGQGRKQFVCFCEDVTSKDIADAIEEGFEDIQTLKRYSTVTMGPCQGKMCHKALVSICSQQTGTSIGETGVTTARPPTQPIPLAALAGPSHMPIKRTPIDRKHRELGALMVELGPWQRSHNYGDPQEECLAVRQRVGIIDVSTLGKLDVRGRDAPALLDKVYTHRFSDLRVGRIRYGLLGSDNGTFLDDGTVTRLAEDRYFVTTTTGNVDQMEEWFKWWMAGTSMCAHVTNVTPAYGAVNVAGPRARQTLSKLTEADLSETSFRYMRSAQALVAGVPCLLLRIGFVGETGWELHFPAEYGEYLWDSLMDAGNEFGIAPFGLEAQRILRLEKKHIIVGQDTDAGSNPLESDMSWVVRFDKDDFIGRAGLQEISERGLQNKLVGFVMRHGEVPEDGVPVVSGKTPIGRVTSARLSPTIGKGFGLAWVPVEMAEEGAEIHIMVDGKPLPAEVTMRPVYDPEGERLRQ